MSGTHEQGSSKSCDSRAHWFRHRPGPWSTDVASSNRPESSLVPRIVGKVIRIKRDDARNGGFGASSLFLSSITLTDFQTPDLFSLDSMQEDPAGSSRTLSLDEFSSCPFDLSDVEMKPQQSDTQPSLPLRRPSRLNPQPSLHKLVASRLKAMTNWDTKPRIPGRKVSIIAIDNSPKLPTRNASVRDNDA